MRSPDSLLQRLQRGEWDTSLSRLGCLCPAAWPLLCSAVWQLQLPEPARASALAHSSMSRASLQCTHHAQLGQACAAPEACPSARNTSICAQSMLICTQYKHLHQVKLQGNIGASHHGLHSCTACCADEPLPSRSRVSGAVQSWHVPYGRQGRLAPRDISVSRRRSPRTRL